MNLQQSRGFTLVEMMVAMLVLATGIVGSIVIQTTAKKNTFDAVQRARATALAHDMVERIRGNKELMSSYVGVNYGSEDWSDVKLCHSVQDDVNAVTCTPTELATYDKYQWNEALKGANVTRTISSGEETETQNLGGFINPTGCVSVTQGTDVNGDPLSDSGDVVVIITWSGRYETTDARGNAENTITDCGSSESDDSIRLVEVSAYIS